MDDFDAELTEAQDGAARAAAARRITHAAAPDAAAVAALADRISRARSAVLVVGDDVDASGAWDAVLALAERTGLPVWAAPVSARVSFPRSHPQFRGELTPAIGPLGRQLAGHDLVVVVGAPVFRYYPYIPGSYLPEGTELVLLTRDAEEAAKAPVGDAVVADLALTVRALADRLPAGGGSAPAPHEQVRFPEAAEGVMPPLAALTAIAQGAPDNTLWVNESPSNVPQFHEATRISTPGSYLFSAGGGLGFGAAAAVGAQLGAPDRPVVCVIGDGSIHYAVQALWTAAAYRVPVTFVVLSNAKYAILQWFAQLEHAQGAPGLDIPGLDITAVAEGYGVRTHRAQSAGELTKLVRDSASRQDGPVLIDVPVTTELPSL